MNPLNHTTCGPCVFRNGNPQIGCFANRLKEFQDENLVEEKDGYFIIKTLCNSCRNEDWAKSHIEKNESLIEAMKAENADMDAVIYINENNTWKDVDKTIKSLKSKRIFFCVYRNNQVGNELLSRLSNANGVWTVNSCFEWPNRTLISIFEQAKTEYCILLNAGDVHKTKKTRKIIDGDLVNRDFVSRLNMFGKPSEDFTLKDIVRGLVVELYKRPDLV